MKKSEPPLSPSSMVDVILPEAEVSVIIGTGFYQRIQDVVRFVADNKTEDEISKSFELLQKGEEVKPWVIHYHTLLVLCKEFETAALNSGFTKKVTLEEYLKMFES
jgi:hypothetical protein